MEITKAILLCLNLLMVLRSTESVVPQQEVVDVNNILVTMGATNWRFNGDTCNLDLISEVPTLTQEANASIGCDCNSSNNSDCHVVRITMKFYSLPGVLSPELMKLPYLKSIDFAYNYLNGTIPPEWGMTQLQEISVLGNQLTGKIPPELGNITTLTKLDLEANYLTGTVPSQLGRLFNLKSLILSSNRFTGTLPAALGELRNLTNFRVNDNNFSGPIPDFIQNWRQLTRLEMVGSGLEGPIPSNISLLEDLTDLRISDMAGSMQRFPPLNNASGLIRLVLRNCNISGELPAYVWMFRELEMLHNLNEYKLTSSQFLVGLEKFLYFKKYKSKTIYAYILQACQLQKSKNYEELFDGKLGSKINKEEAMIMVKVALLCTNGSPSIRPQMSEVVSMLEGRTCVPDIDPEAGGYTDDLRFKAMRDFREDKYNNKNSQTHHSNSVHTDTFSLSSCDHSKMEPIDTR
ncbi:hypothetical protein R6Q57_003567 [Mikania cordata]